MRRTLIIDGHPDPAPGRLIHALASAYVDGANAAGNEVERITLSTLDFPLLRQSEDFWHGQPPAVVADCQQAIMHADPVVILFPLWLCSIPAFAWGFTEQVTQPGFAFQHGRSRLAPSKGLLQGRSARVVITMGMPVLISIVCTCARTASRPCSMCCASAASER
jgi:putative NADPH-quinone reductase